MNGADGLTARTEKQYSSSRNRSLMRERPPLPRNMMVELTNTCNHACTFCPNPHMKRQRGRIDSDLMRRIILEAYEAGVREIGFYATGEPFADKRLAEFTKLAKTAGFEYTYISTNGALATPKRAKAVIDAGMDSIKFSINAGSRETYALIHGRDDWDTVLSNIRWISNYRRTDAAGLKLYLTCVVTRRTEAEVETIKNVFGPIVDDMTFDTCTPLATPEHMDDENGICPMPFNRLHVTCEGYLTLCCVDFQNYLAVADLSKTSIADAWHSDPFLEIRRRHLRKDISGTFCGRCWWKDPAPVAPLVPTLASLLDFEAYDKIQRDWIDGNFTRRER